MKQIFLEPIVISLLLINLVILFFIFISFIEKKNTVDAFEKVFIASFLIIISGTILPPFNTLNPSALGLAKTKLISFTVISQFFFYSLNIFLLRSRLHYLYPSMIFLLRDPYLSGLLLITVLSGFWSETPGVTFKSGMVLLGVAILAAYTAFRYNFQEIGKILRLSGILIAVSGACVSILVPSLGTTPEKEGGWNGVFGHPNTFAAWLAFASTLWLLHAIVNPKHRWLSIGFSLLCLFIMLRAHSGSSILIFLVMFSVMVAVQLFRHLRFKEAVVAFVLIVISAIFLLILISIGKDLILTSLGKDATLTGRTDFWPEVIRSILKRPILGYGYEGFWQSWRGTDNPAAHIINPNGFVPPHSHNGYLEIALALGIGGIMLFFLSLLVNLARFLIHIPSSKKNEAEISALMLIFILMPNFSEVGLWGVTHYTFLYVFWVVRMNIDISKIRLENKGARMSSYSSAI